MSAAMRSRVFTAVWRAGAVVRCAGTGRPRPLVSILRAGGHQRGSPLVIAAGGGRAPGPPMVGRYAAGAVGRARTPTRPPAPPPPATPAVAPAPAIAPTRYP